MAALSIALGGCAARTGAVGEAVDTPPPLSEPCREPNVDVFGWQRVERDGFTLRVPSRYQPHGVVDLWRAAFVRGSNSIEITLGRDPHALNRNTNRVIYARCTEAIGGRFAEVVSYREAGNMFGVSALWRHAHGADDLLIDIRHRNRRELESLRQVLWTVVFKGDVVHQ